MWSNLQRIIEHFNQKIVIRLSKIWVWDQRTRKKTFSGSQIQGIKNAPDPGSGTLVFRLPLQRWLA